MATQVSPGVVIKERDLSSATIVGALTNWCNCFFIQKRSCWRNHHNFNRTSINRKFWFTCCKKCRGLVGCFGIYRYGGRLAVVRIENDGLLNAASGILQFLSEQKPSLNLVLVEQTNLLQDPQEPGQITIKYLL